MFNRNYFLLYINLTRKSDLKPLQIMTLFQQVLNPITGRCDWISQTEDYDYHQEVANTGFGDMLHDQERNQKYYNALRKTITEMHANGRTVHLLDIGTGTGILSMMAVAAGADTVTACESFIPMANCAERILRANGMSNKIKLLKKRSTQLKIGVDMECKANLLVTEILDTELIGEGAIGIYNHAHAELLTDDVVCIPSQARCYAQIVESPLAAQWNSLKAVADFDGDILLKPPPEIAKCKGSMGLHDMQLSQLPLDSFRPLTTPMKIFEFDFNRKQPRELVKEANLTVTAQTSGSTDLIFYWWDIKMDLAGEIVLSCAPFWAHPDYKERAKANKIKNMRPANLIPWRDHWMQAVFYPPKSIHLPTANSKFILNCNHDEYSMWFNIFPAENASVSETTNATKRPMCDCRFHLSYSRSRIGQMNQSQRNKRYLSYLEKQITENSNALVLGDGCLLGLTAAKLGAQSVICYESKELSKNFMESVIKHNALTNVQLIGDISELTQQPQLIKSITHIFAEPYFINTISPWDNFYFGTLISQIKDELSANVRIAPHAARIYALPMSFLDLHKIRAPIGKCEGFDLTLFDEMVNSSATKAQSAVEAQPLWEYPGVALAEPQELLCVDFKQFDENKATNGKIDIKCDGSLNGIALWVDWHLDETNKPNSIVTTGTASPITVGQYVKWDMFVRQGVHLMKETHKVQTNANFVRWSVSFKPKDGALQFHFEVV